MNEFEIFDLNYTENLSYHYNKLTILPGFVLLESNDRQRGRYDILSAYPYEQIKLSPEDASVEKVFEQLQRKLPLMPSVADLPFQGGMIGYFSYDFGARLMGIQTSQLKLYNPALVIMGLYDWALIVDHTLKKISLFAANSRSDTADIVKEIISLWQGAENMEIPFQLKETFSPLITQAAYQEAFQAIHQDLKRGRAYQVNYTQPFRAFYTGETWSMYEQICRKNPVPFSAFLRMEDLDILSFSPERFLTRTEKGSLLTSPIKGTERRVADPQEDKLLAQRLLASTKNRAENVMIVDLLRNDLGQIAEPGTVEVKSLCELQSYKSVHHLVSHIEAVPQANYSMFDSFKACFPGGSITGAPKLESMKIIAEQEPYCRGVYCGSIAYFSRHGHFDSNIAIRTLIAQEDSLYLSAGGGLVIDSDWEDEYRECFTKIAAIVNGLN